MTDAKKLFYNTLMLTLTAFIMRTVSVSFNVYLTNKIGAQGIGLFELINAVYATAVTFSVAGIRLASMRLVADSMALGRSNQRCIMNRCLLYGFLCGAFIGGILYIGGNRIAASWIGNPQTGICLKILSVSLPFVSMSAALNGYFTSAGKIMRYTFVQLLEQIFKIAVTVVLLNYASNKGMREACAAIVGGISLAEMFSLTCSFSLYRIASLKEKEKHKNGIWKSLFRIALPDAVGSQMRSVLTTVEHLLIPKGLAKAGGSTQQAISTYGVIHGMSLPIVLYPSALLSSLSGLLVPEISSHYVSGRYKRIHYMIKRVIHLSLLFSIGTAGIMYYSADYLSVAFYGDNQAGFYIRVIAPLIPVMYMDMSVDGILKGLDQQMSYMKYNIIDATSCVVLVYFLVPIMSVKGYIFVIYISELINFVLSFRRLCVVSEVSVELFKDIIIPLLSVISSCLCVWFFNNIFTLNLMAKMHAAVSIILCCIIYFTMLRIFNAVDGEEMKWLKNLFKGKRAL